MQILIAVAHLGIRWRSTSDKKFASGQYDSVVLLNNFSSGFEFIFKKKRDKSKSWRKTSKS